MKIFVTSVMLILAYLFTPSLAFGKETEIRGLRIWPSPESTRVVFDLNGPVQYEQKEAKNTASQKRIILVIKQATLKTDVSRCKLENTRIKQIKSSLEDKNQLKLILELEKPLKSNSFTLPPNQEYGHRLVLDLVDEAAEAAEDREATEDALAKSRNPKEAEQTTDKAKRATSLQSAVPQDKKATEKAEILAMFSQEPEQNLPSTSPKTSTRPSMDQAPAKVSKLTKIDSQDLTSVQKSEQTNTSNMRIPSEAEISKLETKTQSSIPVKTLEPQKQVFLVAIDAGHGGEDPGAIGQHGTKEKDVVLGIAKYLKAMIDQEPGMKAVLIRSGDYYVGLQDRMGRARKHKADLFVSVHADAFHDKRAEGASVFTLSERGASSTAAKWLADRENRSDLIGGVKLANKNKVLASVLLDLTQSASKEEGLKAATQVLNSLGKVGSLHRGEVEQAGFAVLKAPDVPSILVETGFISHPATERKLKTPAHQKKIAAAIMGGIRRYAIRRPQ